MDWLDDVGDFIEDVADGAAGVVEGIVNAAEEVVSDVVETLGNAIDDALAAVGEVLGHIPVVGFLLAGLYQWLGHIVSSLLNLIGALVKGVLGIVSGVIAGLIRVIIGGFGGLLAWDSRMLVKGFFDIVSGVFGPVVVVVGKLIALVQSILFLQWGERRLSDDERNDLRRVFRGSVALYNVRVIEGFAGLFSINSRPFTLGNTIYLKDVDPATDRPTLVHECTHVWQYQNRGARYAADALGAQWFVDNAYSWEDELGRGHSNWEAFNAEAQASFIEDIYRFGNRTGAASTATGEFFDDDPVGPNVAFNKTGVDMTKLATETVAILRGDWAWRLSNLF